MRRTHTARRRTPFVLLAMAAATIAFAIAPAVANADPPVMGAGFTTYDALQDGCNDSPNGIDCNNYDTKDDVYQSGGPSAAGLSDGTYYWAVLEPGTQNGGFVEGAIGNLSDTTSHVADGHLNDTGSGDAIANRTFHVSGHELVVSGTDAYAGGHFVGTAPNGRRIVQLIPYDDTNNEGGVYILAICQLTTPTGATSPSECKYDAFRVTGGEIITPKGVISGLKYYDANQNGIYDPDATTNPGEQPIADWPINLADGFSTSTTTDVNGEFQFADLNADVYYVSETQANSPWVQTGNTADQTSSTGSNFLISLSNFIYQIAVVDGTTSGVNFGNVCRPAPGGLTIGFWSNNNGAAIFGRSPSFTAGTPPSLINSGQTDLQVLVGLNLRDTNQKVSPTINGLDFDPASYNSAPPKYKPWLVYASATNMAYMLSAQLSGTVLNLRHGITNGTVVVDGSRTVYDEVVYANSLLANPIASGPFAGQNGGLTVASSALRTEQDRVKTILDKINNGGTFTQPTQDTCPDPTFP